MNFLSRIASSVLKVNCYQWGSCVGGPSASNSPFGHGSHSHNIRPLDNHLSGLSISLSSLALSWVYRLPFFKSLVWLGCDSNSQPPVLVASALPLHYQSVNFPTANFLVRNFPIGSQTEMIYEFWKFYNILLYFVFCFPHIVPIFKISQIVMISLERRKQTGFTTSG